MLCYTCNAFLFALLLTDVICDMYNCSSLFLCFFLSSYLFFLFHSGWQNSSNCSRSHWRAFHPGHSGSNICSLCEKEEHQKEKSLEKILGNRGEMLISSLYVLRDFHQVCKIQMIIFNTSEKFVQLPAEGLYFIIHYTKLMKNQSIQ